MAERTRRHAKRPRAFAVIFGMVAAIAALSIAGLVHLAGTPI
jgi:hypothetical protein